MLINKWLVIDSFTDLVNTDWKDGFCLDLSYESGNMSELFLILQRLPPENPFAILLSEKLLTQNVNDSWFDSILPIFFQPSYFLDIQLPVIFWSNKATNQVGFVERLSEKCMKQGLGVLILRTKDFGSAERPETHVYEVTSRGVDQNAIVESWLSQYLEHRDPAEIHFLFRKDEEMPGILEAMRRNEEKLYNTELYRHASLFYEKQRLIEKYKIELDLMVSAERDTQLYLRMQKKQTADNVQWYHHEYEVLPAWYKRFGHVIKVMTGKRSFRSLFSDKVKKHRD